MVKLDIINSQIINFEFLRNRVEQKINLVQKIISNYKQESLNEITEQLAEVNDDVSKESLLHGQKELEKIVNNRFTVYNLENNLYYFNHFLFFDYAPNLIPVSNEMKTINKLVDEGIVKCENTNEIKFFPFTIYSVPKYSLFNFSYNFDILIQSLDALNLKYDPLFTKNNNSNSLQFSGFRVYDKNKFHVNIKFQNYGETNIGLNLNKLPTEDIADYLALNSEAKQDMLSYLLNKEKCGHSASPPPVFSYNPDKNSQILAVKMMRCYNLLNIYKSIEFIKNDDNNFDSLVKNIVNQFDEPTLSYLTENKILKLS